MRKTQALQWVKKIELTDLIQIWRGFDLDFQDTWIWRGFCKYFTDLMQCIFAIYRVFSGPKNHLTQDHAYQYPWTIIQGLRYKDLHRELQKIFGPNVSCVQNVSLHRAPWRLSANCRWENWKIWKMPKGIWWWKLPEKHIIKLASWDW